VPAESGESQKPEASTDDTEKGDFARRLTQEAADEAEKIDKAMGASGKDTEAKTPDESEIQAVSSEVPVEATDEAEAIDAAIAETKPEIHGIGSEIKPETTDETESSYMAKPESDVTTTEPEPASTTVEDAPFPAPPVDVDESGADTDVGASDGNETETGAEGADTIGGADVHLDRAEYLKPEKSAADIDSNQQEKGEASGAEVIDFTKHIDALNAAEEAVRNAKQDLIDRQKAA
jgi:hypothetical protein